MTMPLVLLVGNTAESLRTLEDTLTEGGYDTQTLVSVESAADGLPARPDVIIFDLTTGFPEEVILPFLKEARLEGEVAVLAALSLEQLSDLDVSLSIDDFFVWPGRPIEVQARVRHALWRRAKLDPAHIIRAGDLLIDTANYKVYLAGHPVDLTYKEYELLRFLATNREKVFTREALLNRVWGYDYFGGARTVDVHIRRLRSKIEDRTHTFIETVRNVGYRFRVG